MSGTNQENVPNPALPIDIQLKAIWMELLSVEDIRGTDNFVELGGDSIAATLCINRIRTALGVDIPVTALLFEDATFASLVAEIEQAGPLLVS